VRGLLFDTQDALICFVSIQVRGGVFSAIWEMCPFTLHFERKVSDVFTLRRVGAGSGKNRPFASVFLDFLG
jgi:hypothetical protein